DEVGDLDPRHLDAEQLEHGHEQVVGERSLQLLARAARRDRDRLHGVDRAREDLAVLALEPGEALVLVPGDGDLLQLHLDHGGMIARVLGYTLSPCRSPWSASRCTWRCGPPPSSSAPAPSRPWGTSPTRRSAPSASACPARCRS